MDSKPGIRVSEYAIQCFPRMALLLPHSLFIHIPKTGGSWVRRALHNAGVPLDEVIAEDIDTSISMASAIHVVPSKLRISDRFRFAFVRHPLSFYQSYWTYKMMEGWQDSNSIDNIHQNADFALFIRSTISECPEGWVTRLYRWYTGKEFDALDFIGHTECLEDDLVAALTFAGEEFDEKALRATPRLNVASQLAEWRERCAYTPDLRQEVYKADRATFEHFGYQEATAGMPLQRHHCMKMSST